MSRPAERPVLCSDSLVVEIIAGRKTQTRRVVQRQPSSDPTSHDYAVRAETVTEGGRFGAVYFGDRGYSELVPCPYDAEALWLREAWRVEDAAEAELRYRADTAVLRYLDGGDAAWWKQWRAHSFRKSGEPGWCPGIYLPRWASRISLHGITVRVERLQAISEADAKAEGVSLDVGCLCEGDDDEPGPHLPLCRFTRDDWPGETPLGVDDPHRMAFAALWDSINAARGFPWASNPWVWVVGWKRAEVRT